MKKILLTSLLINAFFINAVFGDLVRAVDADLLRSSDHSKTWTPPSASDTLVGRASSDTLTNKTIDGDDNTISDVSLTSSVKDVLPVANGGTNLSATPTNGQLLIGNGTGYTQAGLTGTANQISVTNGSGSITLSIPQDIATSSSPSFSNLSVTNATYSSMNVGRELTILQSTGLLSGGVLSVNADPTKFDVAAGEGYIVNSTNFASPSKTKITWSSSLANTVTNLATQDLTYVLVNSSGTIYQQSTFPTPAQRRSNIFLGRLNHASRTSIYFKVPIAGWSSSQLQSQDADTRVISARYATNTGSYGTGINLVDFGNVFKDTHNSVTTGGAWKYTAKTAGTYKVSSSLTFTSAVYSVGHVVTFYLYKNGVAYATLDLKTAQTTSAIYIGLTGSTEIDLIAGDYIDIRVTNDRGTTALVSSNNNNYVDIFKISGPSQIAASESVNASYWVSANFAASTSTPINFDSKEFDSHSAVTVSPTAWRFTAPSSGTYDISNLLFISSGACNFYLYKNGTMVKYLGYTDSAIGVRAITSVPLKLLEKDYIEIRPDASVTVRGGALNTNVTGYISIKRTGNY